MLQVGVPGAEPGVWPGRAGGGRAHGLRRHEPHPPRIRPVRDGPQPEEGRVLQQKSRLLLLTCKSSYYIILFSQRNILAALEKSNLSFCTVFLCPQIKFGA